MLVVLASARVDSAPVGFLLRVPSKRLLFVKLTLLVFLRVAEMGKFMKPGKVVMVLAGRYAGRKAVIVKVRPIYLEVLGF